MAIVSVAIVLSFHLKSQPSKLELRMARPLGFIFWLLSLSCLMVGFCNYMRALQLPSLAIGEVSRVAKYADRDFIETVNKYSRKTAIVQTGWRTQSVRAIISRLHLNTETFD
jgi:hypothetical protein